MRAYSPSVIAALSSSPLRVAQLLLMTFASGIVALTSANHDIDFAGVTYRGAAGLGAISEVNDSPGEVKGLQLEMSGVTSEAVALALSDSSIVQGASLVIRLAILAEDGTVIDAPIDWSGTVDTMPIEETGETCTVAITAESSAVDLLRGNALTTSNADQQLLYPGDRAFEFVESQAGVPIVWPTKQLFMAMR